MKLAHLHGRLDPATRNWRSVRASRIGMGDVVLPGVDVHYAILEIPLAEAVANLPPAFHPAIPGVIGATFIKAPQGPFGPFEFAVIGIGCRSGIRPRYLTLAAFASTDAAVEEMRTRYGFPVRRAEVRTLAYYDKVISTIIENDRTLLEISTGKLVTLTGPGATVVYCPALNMVDIGSKQQFIQVDLSAEFKRVARGEPNADVFDGQRLAQVSFSPVDPVSGTLVRADLTIHDVKYAADALVSAEEGGARKLQVAAEVN